MFSQQCTLISPTFFHVEHLLGFLFVSLIFLFLFLFLWRTLFLSFFSYIVMKVSLKTYTFLLQPTTSAATTANIFQAFSLFLQHRESNKCLELAKFIVSLRMHKISMHLLYSTELQGLFQHASYCWIQLTFIYGNNGPCKKTW